MRFLKFCIKYYCKSRSTLLTYDSECGTLKRYKKGCDYK